MIASGGEPVGGVQFLLYPQGDSVDATSVSVVKDHVKYGNRYVQTFTDWKYWGDESRGRV